MVAGILLDEPPLERRPSLYQPLAPSCHLLPGVSSAGIALLSTSPGRWLAGRFVHMMCVFIGGRLPLLPLLLLFPYCDEAFVDR